MTTLQLYIDRIARANVDEGKPAPKAKGNLSRARRPVSVFNPLFVDTAPTTDEDIDAAYDKAVIGLIGKLENEADRKQQLEAFAKVTRDQRLKIVREIPGSGQDVEAQRCAALMNAAVIKPPVPQITAIPESSRQAAKDAAKTPDSVFQTCRKLNDANEFKFIAILLLRQNYIDAEAEGFGLKWIRNHPQMGTKTGKDGVNDGEQYQIPAKTSKGTETKRWRSIVEDYWSKTADGAAQLEMIRQVDIADDPTSIFHHLTKPLRKDERMKHLARFAASLKLHKDMFRLDQGLERIENKCPQLTVMFKYKYNKDGEQTKELRNSKTPIMVAMKADTMNTVTEMTCEQFIRMTNPEHMKTVFDKLTPEQQKKGPTLLQLIPTRAAPNSGTQGGGHDALGKNIPVNVTAKQVVAMVTGPLATFFDKGKTVDELQEYKKRVGQLTNELVADSADEDVLTTGNVLSELEDAFHPFRARYSFLVAKKAEAKEKERAAANAKK